MKDKEPKIKILVACHKADHNIRKDEIYMPIQVGKALHPDLDLGFQCDNTGDNISEKNGSYCELTALYWAWKNLKNVDYIGLCHYRRYFDMDMSEKSILNILKQYNAIALKPRLGTRPVISDLSALLTLEDIAIMIDELVSLYPDYKNDAVNYLLNNNAVSQCNMFIISWSEFDKYCNFIFPLLRNIEGVMKPHSYTRLKRNLGYISECLQGLYFKHNKLKIKYIDKLEIGNRQDKSFKNKFVTFVCTLLSFIRIPKTEFDIYESVIVGLKHDGINLKNY